MGNGNGEKVMMYIKKVLTDLGQKEASLTRVSDLLNDSSDTTLEKLLRLDEELAAIRFQDAERGKCQLLVVLLLTPSSSLTSSLGFDSDPPFFQGRLIPRSVSCAPKQCQ